MNTQRIVRIGLSLALVVSLSLMFKALHYLHQENALSEVRRELGKWQRNGYVDETGDSRTRVARHTGSQLVHPGLSSLATQVYEWFAWESRLSSARSKTFRDKSLETAAATLAMRPASADAWASLFGNLMLSEGFLANAQFALHRAVILGGWELQTQRTLAILGINYWDYLDSQAQTLVVEIVRRGILSDMTHHPRRLDRDIIDLAYQRQWQDHLKPLLVNDDQRAYFRQLASR